MPATMTKGRVPMEMKKLSISAKRQITIPQKFFTMLGFDTEAECTVRGNELVIRPARANTGGICGADSGGPDCQWIQW